MGVAFPKRWKKFSWDVVWRGGITGVFLSGAYVTQTIGLAHTTPGTNAFLTATYAVMVPFMMWGITKKAPTIFNVIAALLGFVGIGLVSFDGGLKGFDFMGEGMTIICGIFFALQIVFIAILGKGKDSILFTVFELLGCGICTLILYLTTELDQKIVLEFDSAWRLAYLTIMGTAFALLAMTWGMEHTDTCSASLIMSLEAVFGVIFSILLYNEKVTLQVGVGFAIIFIALVISEYVNGKYQQKKFAKKPDGEV